MGRGNARHSLDSVEINRKTDKMNTLCKGLFIFSLTKIGIRNKFQSELPLKQTLRS